MSEKARGIGTCIQILAELYDCNTQDLQLNVTLNPSVKDFIVPAMQAYADMKVKEAIDDVKEFLINEDCELLAEQI